MFNTKNFNFIGLFIFINFILGSSNAYARNFYSDTNDLLKVSDNYQMTHLLSVEKIEKLSSRTTSYSALDSLKNIKSGFTQDWIPTGEREKAVSQECHHLSLEEGMRAAKNEVEQRDFLKKYFKKCEQQLSKNAESGLNILIKLLGIKYSFFDRSDVQSFRIDFNQGKSAFAFLGLKKNKRLPLVIVKCGLFCQADASATTMNLMAHLFDESPFHVLFIGSDTGVNNILANRRVSFGGFYEAQELIAISHWAKDESFFKDQVTEEHLLGISLGGSTALYSSLYQQGEFQSVFAYCPVVDLRASIENLYQSGVVGNIIGDETWSTIQQVQNYVPDLSGLFTGIPSINEYPLILGEAATRFLKRETASATGGALLQKKIRNLEDFWEANDFLLQLNHSFQTTLNRLENNDSINWGAPPVLVLASQDDMVVINSKNTGALEKAPVSLLDQGNLDVLNLKYGNHCAMSLAYGWKTMSSLFRGYFVSHSPSLMATKKILSVPQLKTAVGSKPFAGYNWTYQSGSDVAQVKLLIAETCTIQDGFFTKEEDCFEGKTYSVPLKELHQEKADGVNAEALTRWLNTNVHVLSQGQSIVGTQLLPDQIMFEAYTQRD